MTALHPDGSAVPAAPAPPPGAPSGGARAAFDRALRAVGGLVAVLLAAVTALIEIFYSPLRAGGVLVGASAAVAMVVNYALVRYTVAVTGARWAAMVPALVWFGMMIVASGRRGEGDLLLAQDNWVALVTIFAGSLAFAIAGYRMMLAPTATLAAPLSAPWPAPPGSPAAPPDPPAPPSAPDGR